MAENQEAQIELHQRLAARYVLRYGTAASRVFYRDWHASLWNEVDGGVGAPRVLDLACGTGALLEHAPRRPALPPVGLDLSPDMLAVARAKGLDVRWVRADAEHLPFGSARFDAVFLKGCLHHLRDHECLLRDVWRVLVPGGLAIVSEPQEDAPWVRWARRALYKLSRGFDPDDRGFRTRELERMVEGAGFHLVASRPYGIFAYAAAGFPDHLPVLRWLPGAGIASRCLVTLDRALLSFPPFSCLAFQRILVARKREA